MKKILLSCTYFLPNISGVTVYVDILAKELSKKGHRVSILTSRHDKKLAKNENIGGVKVFRSNKLLSVNKGILMPFFWWDSFWKVKKADVIFANLPQVESIFLAIWSKIWAKKFIIIHHCEFNFGGSLSNKIISLITYPIHLISYLLADQIISYTKDYADTSIFLRYFKKKLEFILPPVVVSKPKKSKQRDIQKKIAKKRGQKIIGFVGRIAWEKGIDHLIGAVLKIDNTKLILVGPYKDIVGDNSFGKIKKLIDNNKDKVMLWGAMKHEELVDFYKICDCLVLPSTNNLETFGIVQAEAMISSCPVVASDLAGVRVPVEMTGLGQIAKVGDSIDLAQKIKKVLETKYDKKLFSEARHIFSLDKFVESYQKCLKQ